MSAFLVSKAHIDALVYARAVAQRPGIRIGEGYSDRELGELLWRENERSIAHLYADARTASARELAAKMAGAPLSASYVYTPPREAIPVVALIKAIHCYAYQASEHKGWEASDAAAMCEALEHALVRMLPGYDAAPWGID